MTDCALSPLYFGLGSPAENQVFLLVGFLANWQAGIGFIKISKVCGGRVISTVSAQANSTAG